MLNVLVSTASNSQLILLKKWVAFANAKKKKKKKKKKCKSYSHFFVIVSFEKLGPVKTRLQTTVVTWENVPFYTCSLFSLLFQVKNNSFWINLWDHNLSKEVDVDASHGKQVNFIRFRWKAVNHYLNLSGPQLILELTHTIHKNEPMLSSS